MSQTELDQLERDVETARDRVTQDLERLRSPSTLSDFKDGIRTEAYAFRDDLVGKATAYRDDLVDKTTNAVRDRAQGLLADIKERAAANPLAALAIGAGLAWRLLHKPPIATVPNTGTYIDSTGDTGRARYTYQVCEAGTQTCSDEATVRFQH